MLVSIGYAACHWCHVMAHESFEDAETAAFLNAHFVAVKVDREERPDVDAVYMEATTALTGHGGWPMTVFTTPDGRPFYCGTYFPPTPRHGMPSFRQLLASVAQTWGERREEVVAAGQRIVDGLAERAVVAAADGTPPPSAELLDEAVRSLSSSYDVVRGGFGDAPKFPPSMVLELLLRHHARTGDPDALRMVEQTCEAMARGGIYDQLAGGFARYSVDAGWVVPHFEKMLYDNALLLRVYTHLWRATGSALARRVALETADWMVRELRTAEGGFASALDADTEGVEGLTYAWTPAQLVDVLGDDDGAWAARLLEVTPGGTFEHGSSTLQLLADPDDAARWAEVRARLLAARATRPQPARDDKVVAAWNGLAIAGLAETGALLDRPDLVAAAVTAADLLLDVHLVDGRLRRVSRDGRVGEPAGVLEDHADVAEGLLSLLSVTGDPRWLTAAGQLLDTVLEHFADGAGGFYDTADDRADVGLVGDAPAAGPDRQRDTGRLVGRGGSAAHLRGGHRVRAAPRCRGARAGRLHRAGPARPVRRMGPGGGRGAARRAAGGRGARSDRRPGDGGAAQVGADGHRTGRGRRPGRPAGARRPGRTAARRPAAGGRPSDGVRLPALRVRPRRRPTRRCWPRPCADADLTQGHERGG